MKYQSKAKKLTMLELSQIKTYPNSTVENALTLKVSQGTVLLI